MEEEEEKRIDVVPPELQFSQTLVLEIDHTAKTAKVHFSEINGRYSG